MNGSKRSFLFGKLILLSMVFYANQAEAQDTVKTGFSQKSSTMVERWELGAQNHKGFF